MCWQLLGTVHCPGFLLWSGGCWGAWGCGGSAVVSNNNVVMLFCCFCCHKAIWWQLRLGEGLVIAKFVKLWVIVSGLLVPLPKVQKPHLSFMTNSPAVISFDLGSCRSFSDRTRWEVAAQEKNEVSWLKILVIPTLLGKFQLSLLGGDVPVVSHRCHLSHGHIYWWNCRS